MRIVYLKRRNFLILFGLLILIALFYIIYTLNQVAYDVANQTPVGFKKKVQNLDKQIDELNRKTFDTERDLKELEKFYKNVDNSKNDSPQIDNQQQQQQQKSGKNLTNLLTNNKEYKYEENRQGPYPLANDRILEEESFEMDKNGKLKHRSYKSRLRYEHYYQLEKDHKSYEKQCEWLNDQNTFKSDIQTYDLFSKLPFDDIDGGVWKQGFDISYNEKQWTSDKKLNVIVVPHSHNDPGWIMKFEEYFSSKTKYILDTIVNTLSEKESRKFIWAEISYLSLWWNQANDEMKNKMRRLIVDTQQLEIVTGGWVMTDEANSHYYATIEQMIEGHEWLRSNIDASLRPKFGWSIDPFGYTPTMAYLLKQMGFDAMLIQRVHYHIKKYMAQTLRFEFNWRQSWSTQNSKDTSIFCHVMPFYSYDIPHTCGPDPKICCQFDFKRYGTTVTCPWGIKPQLITDKNVHERANTLLDQYRKKSQLYGDIDNHNVLLVPLGDDFRYTDTKEALAQFDNYQKLMDYMNSQADWNVNIKFGTLKDYFETLFENNYSTKKKVESFSGDFFTYADRQDHYWSGYFTSRPFSKRLSRLVEYYLRSAEIVFSYSNLLQKLITNKFTNGNGLYKKLLVARRNLGLFQHHDGITGTSKTPVVADYASKLYDSLKNCKEIIENSVSYLLTKENKADNIYSIEDVRLGGEYSSEQDKKSIQPTLKLANQNDRKQIVLYNPSLNERVEIVSFRVNTPHVEVLDHMDTYVTKYQIALVWPNTELVFPYNPQSTERMNPSDDISFVADFESNEYELLFEVTLAPLSLTTFTIRRKLDTDKFVDKSSKVTFYQTNLNPNSISQAKTNIKSKLAEPFKSLADSIDFVQTNNLDSENDMIRIKTGSDYDAVFSSKTGFLTKLSSDTKQIKSKIKFIKYGTTDKSEKSGAYLFLPDGSAVDLQTDKLVQWIRVEQSGELRNRVCVNMTVLLHCVELNPTVNKIKNSKFPIFNIWNMVDLRQSHNFELAMHMETDIQNDNIIYTDLNGFQFIKRKKYDKLTLQGNVYPMPTGAFIQDSEMRLNLLSGQPLGVASLDPSSIQVFLDRRLDQDDNRGMEQAMDDNVLTPNKFIIYFESLNGMTTSTDKADSSGSNFQSLASQWLSFDLLNPIVKLILNNNQSPVNSILKLSNQNKNYPCDLRLVNMRTMQQANEEPMSNQVGLIFHRVPYEDCPSAPFVQLPSYLLNKCNSEQDSQSFSFEDFFEFFTRKNSNFLKQVNVTSTYLTLQPKTNDYGDLTLNFQVKSDEKILNFIQPMQIEAFKVDFN